jgi:hypothetical protein
LGPIDRASLCLWNPTGVVAGARGQRPPLSIGPNSVSSICRRRQNPVSEMSFTRK